MADTHRIELPKDVDPVDYLYGDTTFFVPKERFTPEIIARFYKRSVQNIDMRGLFSKSDRVQEGLESLPRLLRYDPEPHRTYGTAWLQLNADPDTIKAGLPEKTPYELQYLPLFSFGIPIWKDIDRRDNPSQTFPEGRRLDIIKQDALLFGKNRILYFATGMWYPQEVYNDSEYPPKRLERSLQFDLKHLQMEAVDWLDERILERITSGEWAGFENYKTRLHMILAASAEQQEYRFTRTQALAEQHDLSTMPIGN